MTEDEARQVLLLQAHESAGDRALAEQTWTPEDRSWATRQAVSAVGDRAEPERFVLARAAVALQRLLPRLPAAQRWLRRRAWHPAWVWLAALAGLVLGVVADQLGPPQRVNLLAPAVWAVVAWNGFIYLGLLVPSPSGGVRQWLAGWAQRADDGVAALWARQAAPLTLQRLALLLHVAAATLALGLIAGLYLRGLVLDYRVGWQSTFLDATLVQAVLDLLLTPARWLTGIAVPAVAPLQLAPGVDARASAAPWIHLLAATLALAVVLPRLLLAWLAAARARRMALHFPLPLDTPYFEALHPLMRPGLTPVVRLLWVAPAEHPPLRLFGHALSALDEPRTQPLTLVQSDEGDQLQLLPVPAGVQGAVVAPSAAPGWWQRWLSPGSTKSPLVRLREDTDVVLLLTRPGQPAPAWVDELGRPVVVLVDSPEAEPPRLSLQHRHDGWLAEGRLLLALEVARPGDPRLPRLHQAWLSQQQQRLDEGLRLVAASLGRIAATHQPVADEGFLARRAEAEAANTALTAALDVEWRAGADALAHWLGRRAQEDAAPAPSTAAAQVKGRLGEGRAALVGGVFSGALVGLKADVLSGGLTLGAGLLTGGLLGALGAAGMAKGLNVVRGTDRSFAAWSETALAPITLGLLQRYLVLVHEQTPEAAAERLGPALATQQAALTALWQGRERRVANEGEAERLAEQLQPLLRQVVQAALGGPTAGTRRPAP